MTSILLTLLISYILLFLYSLRIRDNSIVDVFWGFGFMMIAVISYYSQTERDIIQATVTVLVFLWWARIISHIGFRKLKERKEDARYAKWREEWGSGWYFYIRSFLQIYLLQMILMLVVSVAIIIVNMSVDGYSGDPIWRPIVHSGFPTYVNFILFCTGVVLSLAWLIVETISDLQLSKFIETKKPWEIFTTWLYRYSRHPNYFGESIFWLGISLLALPFSYYWLVSFVVITILLLFISGVPLQEARYAGRPNWEEYKKKTSVFVPWWPKK